jgi:hypothetical protein
MPIQAPSGFLDITNATLRTSNIEAENFKLNGGNIYVTTEFTVVNENVASNVIIFSNVTTGLVTDGKVGVSTRTPDANLHVVGNVHVADTTEAFSTVTGAVTITGGLGAAGNVHASRLYATGNVEVGGNVVAGYLYGDGSNISGISSTLQAITDSVPGANVTSNTIQFTNATTGFVTTASVEVGGQIIMGDHMIPSANELYDIGSASNKIRHLFLSDNSLYLGDNGAQIGADVNGTITMGDLKVSGNATINGSLEKTRALMFRQNVGSYTLTQIGYQDIVDYGAAWKASSENPLYDISIAGDYSSGSETSINFRLVVRNESTGDVLYFPDSTGWKSYVYNKYHEHSYKGIMSGLGIGNLYTAKLEVKYPDGYVPTPSAPTGMEIYYDAKDETTIPNPIPDLSGNSNNGSKLGGVGLDTTDSVTSFTFDGVNDYIYNSRSGYTASSLYTTSMWIKSQPKSGAGTIFQFGRGSSTTTDTGFGYVVVGNDINAYIYGHNDLVRGGIRQDNTWQHVSVTYELDTSGSYSGSPLTAGSRVSLYINGAHAYTQMDSTSVAIASTPYLIVGAQTNDNDSVIGGTYFKGSISNFRLYPTRLTVQQIKDLYDHQKNDFFGSSSNYIWEAQHGDITGTVWD